MITINFIKGLALGVEYVDLDEDDRESMGVEYSLLTSLHLGFIRILFWSGYVGE